MLPGICCVVGGAGGPCGGPCDADVGGEGGPCGGPCEADVIDVKVDGGGALHFVHTVDVEVWKTVEIVLVISKLVLPPVVCVKVTGHVVRVEMTISVVMTSLGLDVGAGRVF